MEEREEEGEGEGVEGEGGEGADKGVVELEEAGGG